MAKTYVEEKIKAKEFEHKVVDVGTENKNYKSKYILDIKTTVVATEYRFYADENGKYKFRKNCKNSKTFTINCSVPIEIIKYM